MECFAFAWRWEGKDLNKMGFGLGYRRRSSAFQLLYSERWEARNGEALDFGSSSLVSVCILKRGTGAKGMRRPFPAGLLYSLALALLGGW